MLFANEYHNYDSHIFAFSDWFSYFITEKTYVEWEIGRSPGDEESSLKGL